jgi:hypothetical protein
MLGLANRDVWINCPASEKWSAATFVARRSKRILPQSAIEDLSPDYSDVNQSRQGEGREGKGSNKEFSKQISAWYCWNCSKDMHQRVDRRVEEPGMERFGNV